MTREQRAFTALITIRQQRGQRLQTALDRAGEAVAEAQAQWCERMQAKADADARAYEGSQRIAALLDAEFRPADFVSAGLRQVGLQQQAAQARSEASRADGALGECQAAQSRLDRARAANEQRLAHFRQQLRRCHAELAQAELEQADEDAQETAVMRLLDSRRRARERNGG